MYIIKLLKNNLSKSIINSFTPESPKGNEQSDNNPFGGDSLQDLKKLREYIQDGKIDSKEAQIINKHYEDIEKEAKDGLREVALNMLKEGFSALNEKSYNSFKILIEKSSQIKLPSWNNIIQKTINNSSEFSTVRTLGIKRKLNKNNFHGIEIKGNIIHVKYDGLGTNDTLELSYYKDTGKLSNNPHFNRWIETENEEKNVDIKGKVEEGILEDNIKDLEEQIQKEELEKKELKKVQEITEKLNNFNGNLEDFKDFLTELFKEDFEKSLLEKYPSLNTLITKISEKLSKQQEEKKQKQEILKQKEKIKKAIEWYKEKPKESIKVLQEKLGIKVDGIVGKQTIKSIMDFQKKNGLVVDGLAGKNTLKALGFENPNNFYKKINSKESNKQDTDSIIESKGNKKEKKSHNFNEKINEEITFPKKLGTYINYKGEKKEIILKESRHPQIDGEEDLIKYIIELDGSTPLFHSDLKKEFDHIPTQSEIDTTIKELLNKNKKLVEKEKEKQAKELKEAKQEKAREKAKEILENMRLSAKDIKPKGVDETKWINWIKEFSDSDLADNIQIDVENIDIENNIVTIEFDDSGLNEFFNKNLKLNGILDSDGNIITDKFNSEIKKAVKNAIKEMIKYKKESKKRQQEELDRILGNN